jgi:hypothetical protein
LWHSGCFFGIPYPCCVCSGEREGNVYVSRAKSGGRTGMLMLIDEENGTLGKYGMKSSSDEPRDAPCCYCYRW